MLITINIIRSIYKQGLQEILKGYSECFNGIGKLNNYQYKLNYIWSQGQTSGKSSGHQGYAQNDVIEEHPCEEPAPWVSNIVIAPKDDGDIHITLDAKGVNDALKSFNFPNSTSGGLQV